MAWAFDETSGHHVTLGDNAALTLPNSDYSIGGWIYFDDNAGSLYQYFLSWGSTSATPSFNWYCREASIDNPDEITIRFNNGSPTMTTTNNPLLTMTGQWLYFLIVRSSNIAKFYIGTTQYGSNMDLTGISVDVADSLYLGMREDNDADRRFGGKMAEWAKWDRALSAGERAGLVKGFAPTFFMNGLKWYVPMVRSYQELIVPLTVTNNSSTVSAHPSIINPAPPFISFSSAVGDVIVTLTKVAMLLTGKSLFANRINPLVKVTTTATGKDIYLAKANTLSNVSLTLTGKDIVVNKVNNLVKVAMTLIGKTVTPLIIGLITLVKVVMTTIGKVFAANKVNALTKVAMVTTGKSLFANMVGVLTNVAMIFTGKGIVLSKLNNLVKGTLTLTGKAVTVLGGIVGRAIRRFFDFF